MPPKFKTTFIDYSQKFKEIKCHIIHVLVFDKNQFDSEDVCIIRLNTLSALNDTKSNTSIIHNFELIPKKHDWHQN